MKKKIRYLLLFSYPFYSIGIFLIVNSFILKFNLLTLLTDWTFLITFVLYLLTIEEFLQWAKNGKRSEMSDIVAIFFFFFLIFFFSKDFLTSIMGAFSIYLWIGIFELRDYPVINKILIISLVTYNVIFIAGLFSYYLGDPFYINTSFAFSFWIILILGFLLFGRKYIVVWRFMSPQYLTLFLYIIAWLAIVFINQYTPLNFILDKPIGSSEFKIIDFFMNIYFILIAVNWVIYFLSGFILDKLLGIQKVKDEKLLRLVNKIKNEWKKIDPVHELEGDFLDAEIREYYSFFDDVLYTVGFTCLLAIVIASLGMFGMATYSIQTRLKEIGVRKVFGAHAHSITFLVSRSYIRMLLVAAIIAAPLGYLINNLWLQYLAHHVSFGAGTLILGIFIVIVIGMLTITSQTMKAANSNPADILKYE